MIDILKRGRLSLSEEFMELTQGELAILRDRMPASRNTQKGALLKESYAVFSAIRSGMPLTQVQQGILNGEVLQKASWATRRSIWVVLKHRYFAKSAGWVTTALAAATEKGLQSAEFISLAYLYFCLRDPLVFDFVTGPIWEKWQAHVTHVDTADFLRFLEEKEETAPGIQKWREHTRKKLAGSNLAALRDFGLLKGSVRKQIQRPSVAPETVFHLLCVLVAEGHEGHAILRAPDWRLFLWSESEVAAALGGLAQRRWIRFEKAGSTVILQLIRTPEVAQ